MSQVPAQDISRLLQSSELSLYSSVLQVNEENFTSPYYLLDKTHLKLCNKETPLWQGVLSVEVRHLGPYFLPPPLKKKQSYME